MLCSAMLKEHDAWTKMMERKEEYVKQQMKVSQDVTAVSYKRIILCNIHSHFVVTSILYIVTVLSIHTLHNHSAVISHRAVVTIL